MTEGQGARGPWTAARAVAWTASFLARRGVDDPRLEAELLLCEAVSLTRVQLYCQLDRPLDPAELARFRALVERRAAGEPLAYIRGRREFYGLELAVTRDCLIPRPETELLVDESLRHLRALNRDALAADIGTGSGAVAVALLKHGPSGLTVFATDCSRSALDVARGNAARHGVLDRLRLLEGDLLEPLAAEKLEGALDLVASNPPYVATAEAAGLPREVRAFEPASALLAGPSGLDFHERLAGAAGRFLLPGGLYAAEVGAGQADAVAGFATASGVFEGIEVKRDARGIPRLLLARRRAAVPPPDSP